MRWTGRYEAGSTNDSGVTIGSQRVDSGGVIMGKRQGVREFGLQLGHLSVFRFVREGARDGVAVVEFALETAELGAGC